MNIFEYKSFPNDVEIYFHEVIEKYDFKINFILNPNDKPINNFVFLENEYCLICLDNISSFPYPDISITFFLKDGLNLLEINQIELRKHLKISDESITNFYMYHQRKYANAEEFEDSSYGSYRYGIKFSGDLCLKYFDSLLNGKLGKTELLKMTKN